jgi:suppressor of fused protein SUFU
MEDVEDVEDRDEAPGWAAIDKALEPIYGDQEPLHWGTILKWRLGGDDPLDGISAYPRTDPVPHWHFVSYGMSELYDKESDNPDTSGWGFELTFRLARDPADDAPPVWAASMLQNLARYVFRSGNWFDVGHHMNINGPIAVEREDSAIRAIAFAVDPELGDIATPHGKVRFLQVVGLTLDELDACQQWNAEPLLDLLASKLPLYVTDVDRASLLDDPQLATAVREGIELDGSSVGWLAVTTAHWDLDVDTGALTIRLGALQAPRIADMLRSRLPYGRDLVLQTEDTTLCLLPAPRWEVKEPEPGVLQLGLPETALDDILAALRPEASRTAISSIPGLTVEIVPTQMRDQYGNETGQVIG